MIAGLGGGGAAAVNLLYDERYAQAGWILQLLALGSWFTVLESTNSAALMARGQAHWVAASNAGKLAGMVVLIPIGFAWGGFPGAVAGLAASDLFKYAVSAVAATRAGLRGWPQDVRLTVWVFASAALGWRVTVSLQASGVSRWSVALAVFVAVTLAWAPLGASLLRARRRLARLES
jgi:O-antigen/teichoic acid export membrane protein